MPRATASSRRSGGDAKYGHLRIVRFRRRARVPSFHDEISESPLSATTRRQAKHEARLRAGKPVEHASLRFDLPKRHHRRKHQQRLAYDPVGDAAPAERKWEEGAATDNPAAMTPQGHFNERTMVRVIA